MLCRMYYLGTVRLRSNSTLLLLCCMYLYCLCCVEKPIAEPIYSKVDKKTKTPPEPTYVNLADTTAGTTVDKQETDVGTTGDTQETDVGTTGDKQETGVGTEVETTGDTHETTENTT